MVHVIPWRRKHERTVGFLIKKDDVGIYISNEELGELLSDLHRVNAETSMMDIDEEEEVGHF